MRCRSIRPTPEATALNGGLLTSAEQYVGAFGNVPAYRFDESPYKARVCNGFGKADLSKDLFYGSNIIAIQEIIVISGNQIYGTILGNLPA